MSDSYDSYTSRDFLTSHVSKLVHQFLRLPVWHMRLYGFRVQELGFKFQRSCLAEKCMAAMLIHQAKASSIVVLHVVIIIITHYS